MPEAEVTLRLAFWLLDQAGTAARAAVAIDGAHVRIKGYQHGDRWIEEKIVFDIQGFLAINGCQPIALIDEWRGTYERRAQHLELRSIHGFDVQVAVGGRFICAECKGSGQPSTQLSSAIGQVVVSASIRENEELWVAVPDTPKFDAAAKQIIANSPALARSGIRIALVGEAGVRVLN